MVLPLGAAGNLLIFVTDRYGGNEGSATRMGTAVIERAAPSPSVRPAIWRVLGKVGGSYLLRRIGKAILTIFFVTSLIFFMIRLLPGNPVEVYINQQIGQYGFSYQDAANQAQSL